MSDIDRIRVIFGTEQLDDEKTLKCYNITHGSVLIFVIRTDGGKKEGETSGEGAEGMIYVFKCVILFRC